jgi:hypothetical protein
LQAKKVVIASSSTSVSLPRKRPLPRMETWFVADARRYCPDVPGVSLSKDVVLHNRWAFQTSTGHVDELSGPTDFRELNRLDRNEFSWMHVWEVLNGGVL